MASKINPISLPAKEFRRKYMKHLISDVAKFYDLHPKEAKVVACMMVSFITEKVFLGERITLGPLSVIPKKKKATVVKSHLKKTGRQVFYMGDQIKWAVAVSKAWQSTTKPEWSKYS